ncbi:MAG: hypothetical protein WCF22_11355, partial [Candidatus Sulfotelmatobacter sp.]
RCLAKRGRYYQSAEHRGKRKFENEVEFHFVREDGVFVCKVMSTKAGYYKQEPIGIKSTRSI